jgi:hypothetical protein
VAVAGGVLLFFLVTAMIVAWCAVVEDACDNSMFP